MHRHLSAVLLCVSLAAAAGAGCVTTEDPTALAQGRAELRVDPRLLRADITHVTVEDGADSHELVRDPQTGTFSGTLVLAAGSHDLVARARAGATEVGVSPPTAVVVEAGVVTRVQLRILDTSGDAATKFGPIFESLVHPTTTEVGQAASFAITVIAPTASPVTYDWSSDCADSTFATPTAAATTWTRPSPGACTINVTAFSNGFSTGQTFLLVVLPAGGTGTGAATVDAVFVDAPTLGISLSELGCAVSPGTNGSCDRPAIDTATAYAAGVVNWGGSTPGTFAFTDDCGGTFGISTSTPEGKTGFWLPPAAGGICILTARAVSGDGISATLEMAVVTKPRGPTSSDPPQLGIQAFGATICSVGTNATTDCGTIRPQETLSIFGSVSYGTGHPGAFTASDDCGGVLTLGSDGIFISGTWRAPSSFFTTCNVRFDATSLEGVSSSSTLRFTTFL
jgi:hypothetical protein